MQVLGVQSGLASLDVDGSGQPANASSLARWALLTLNGNSSPACTPLGRVSGARAAIAFFDLGPELGLGPPMTPPANHQARPPTTAGPPFCAMRIHYRL